MADKKEVIIKVSVEGDGADKAEKLNKSLKETNTNAKKTTETFGLMDTGLGKMAKGVIDFGKKGVNAMRTFKGAVISTGIGALVIAVVALVQYFTKSERGAMKLKVIFAAVGQVVNTVVDTFIKIGETIGKVGKVIGKIFKGTTTLKDGMKEMGEVGKQANKELADSWGGLNDRIKESISLQERENQLVFDRRKNIVQEATLTVQLAQAKERIDDATLSNVERLKSLSEATKLQNQISDERIRIAREEFEIMKAQEAQNESDTETKDALAQKEAELILLEAERADRQKEFTAKRSSMIMAQMAENERLSEQEQKLADDAKARIDDLYEKELEIQQKKQEAAQAEAERLIEEADAAFEAEMERMDEEATIEQEKFLEYWEAMQEIKGELKDIQAETDEERRQLELEKIEAARKYDLDNFAKTEADKAAINELYNKQRDNTNDKYQKLQMQRDKAALSTAANMAGQLSALAKEGSEEAKALAIVEATINTYLSATAAFASAGNPILGAVFAAIAIAAGIANIAKISSAALGGWVGGPSHQNGGVTMNMEGGEYIVNKRAMQNPELAATVIAANNAGNGAGGGSKMLNEGDVALIAASVVQSIPVQIVESEMTEKQRKVQVREENYAI